MMLKKLGKKYFLENAFKNYNLKEKEIGKSTNFVLKLLLGKVLQRGQKKLIGRERKTTISFEIRTKTARWLQFKSFLVTIFLFSSKNISFRNSLLHRIIDYR